MLNFTILINTYKQKTNYGRILPMQMFQTFMLLGTVFLLFTNTKVTAQNNWAQLGQDINGDVRWEQHGLTLSLSGSGKRIIIGSPEDDACNCSSFLEKLGSAHAYEYDGSNWVKNGSFSGIGDYEKLGSSVAISSDGNRLAVMGFNISGSSSVQEYVESRMRWEDLGDNFVPGKVSLSADGNRMVIGYDGYVVKIFEHNSDLGWQRISQDIKGESNNDQIGFSVSLSANGNRVAIGAPSNNENGVKAGHVRIYEENGSDWIQIGADIDGLSAGDQSGYSVSLSADGNRVAIGAPFNGNNGENAGEVRVFEFSNNNWVQIGQINGEAAEDQCGFSVSLSANGNRLVIGAPFNDGNGNNAGQARIFEYHSNSWIQIGEINGEAAEDQCGYAVSLSTTGNHVAVSSPKHDKDDTFNGFKTGQVRIFEIQFTTNHSKYFFT